MNTVRAQRIASLAVAAGLCAIPPASYGQAFAPTRPVELVVHSAAGGGSDVFARALVELIEREKLTEQQIRVINRTAGAGLQAMEYLAQRKGDAHTLAVFTNTWLATPLTAKDAPHTVKSFTPIARLVLEPTIAVVRADAPYRTLADFVAAAREKHLKQAGGSLTAIESLTGLLVQSATGARWSFVPTPAVRDRMANLVAGQVDIVIPQPQDANEHIAAGRVRAIAAFTEQRLRAMPGVPTVREQGIQAPIIANVRGILAPPGVAAEVAGYWEEFFARLAKTTGWQRYLEKNQVEDVFMRGAHMAPFLEEQVGIMREVLRQAGVAVVR